MTRQRQLSLPNWEIKRPEKFSGSLKSRTGIDTQLSIWHGCALFCTLPRRLLRLGYPLELVALAEYKTNEVLLLVRDMVNSDEHFPRCLRASCPESNLEFRVVWVVSVHWEVMYLTEASA
jgi:hypothetical protein